MLPFAAAGTLIPAILTEIDPDRKVALYGMLATAGAVTSMIATIIIGALSDRTRSRLGKRNPWIASGGFILAGASTTMSFTSNFPLLVALWITFQAGLAVVLAPLYAVLPDRVTPGNLGKASAAIGLGQLVAQSLGGIVAGALITVPREGVRWLPWLIAITAVLFVLFAPEPDNRNEPREALSARALLRSFIPPRDRDFLLALVGRFLLLMSFMSVLFYQLFVLTDYIGLRVKETGPVLATGSVIMAVTSGIATALSGPLSDRLGRRKPVVITASLIFAAAEAPLVMSASVDAHYIFLGVGGFAYGIYVAVDQALLTEVLPSSDDRAKDMGILNIANTGPQILAPIGSGLVVTTAGYRSVFVIAIVLAVASALVLLPLRRVR
ncbi:MFS transporter [Streptomyces phaeochromogenes]